MDKKEDATKKDIKDLKATGNSKNIMIFESEPGRFKNHFMFYYYLQAYFRVPIDKKG